MKRILTGLFAIALTIGAAQAQTKEDRKDHGKHHKAQKAMTMQKINLSEDQKSRLKIIREAQGKEMAELNKNENITVKEMKSRKKAISENYKSQFESVLTQEQKTQIKELKKEGKSKGDKMKGKRMQGKKEQAGKMIEDLNLTADQKAKMSQLREDFKTKAEVLRKNESLDKEDKKKAFKKLHEENKAQMKSVLTKEQIEKMEAGRGKR